MDLKIRMFSWARLGGPLKAKEGGREIGGTGDLELRGATEQKRAPRSDKCQDPKLPAWGGNSFPRVSRYKESPAA